MKTSYIMEDEHWKMHFEKWLDEVQIWIENKEWIWQSKEA